MLRKETRLQSIHSQRRVAIALLGGALFFGGARCGAVTLPDSQSGITVQLETNGDYQVHSREPDKLFGGSVGYPIQEIEAASGRDTIGAYKEIAFRWQTPAQYSAVIRRYDERPAVLFMVNAPSGVNATNVVFPTFDRMPVTLHGFSYREENFAPPSFSLEQNGTPWLLFDDDDNAIIISPATNFFLARLSGDGRARIASGLRPEIGALEKPLTHSTLLVFGRGVGATFDVWGRILTDLYGKKRPLYDADPTLKYFGYWTDNGADYYYRYDHDLGYCGTLLKMVDTYRHENIPLGYFQLDSWWYQKSINGPDGKPGAAKKSKDLPEGRWNRYGGTMDYTADPDLFPKGLAAFQKELGLPLVTHGRWVDRESPYQKQFKFSGVAAIDPAYWDGRMAYLATNGVVCYEQDWLDRIYFNSDMGRVIGVGDAFADGMAGASAKHGLDLQYCMALPRHFLQGAKYSSLTTIRTSGDRFEPPKWRHFLYTSQLASALGIWPWCDVFKSGETGNMVLAVLSAGVVGTGDAMGRESPENIRLAARADGVLVKPDKPMVPTDDAYLHEANHDGGALTAWTCTDHGDHRTLYAVAFVPERRHESDSATPWQFSPGTFGIRSSAYVYDVTHKQGVLLPANQRLTSVIPGGSYAFVIIAPVGPSGIALIGDEDKITSTGKQRIADIRDSADGVSVTVLTAPGESTVRLHGFADAAPTCRLVGGKSLPVQYDAATKHFTVTIPAPSAGENTLRLSRVP